MSNPLFSLFNNSSNNDNGFLQRFNQFRSSFQGDPKQQVQNMLNNGQMSQEQFNRLSQMATEIQKTFNIK